MVEMKEIFEQNPWWKIKNWHEFDKHLVAFRESFFQIRRKELEKISHVNLIYGPRQVGKTTFLKIMIKKLVDKNIFSEKIGYFSCDALVTNRRDELREVINFFLERDVKYLFIDEISNVKDWGFEIKYFIDSGRFDNLKTFITGSPFGLKEYLPGRKLNHFYLMPISFRDFLINLSINLNEKVEHVFNMRKSEIEEIKKLVSILDSTSYEFVNLRNLKDKVKKIETYFSLLEKLFFFYIVIGGFPSVINSFIKYKIENNKTYLLEEIKTVKERLIDSLRKAGKKEGICFQLINSIKKRLASRYSFSQLKETEVDLGKETIVNYLNHLKDIFILKIIYAYDFWKGGVGWKKDKKIYLLDPFLYHEEIVLEEDKIFGNDDYLGRIVESIVGINLSYLKEDFLNSLDSFLQFWYNAKEIDFIVNFKEIFGVEIKFRRKIEGMYKIGQVKNYIILTKNNFKFNNHEVLVPASVFLALLKNKDSYL